MEARKTILDPALIELNEEISNLYIRATDELMKASEQLSATETLLKKMSAEISQLFTQAKQHLSNSGSKSNDETMLALRAQLVEKKAIIDSYQYPPQQPISMPTLNSFNGHCNALCSNFLSASDAITSTTVARDFLATKTKDYTTKHQQVCTTLKNSIDELFISNSAIFKANTSPNKKSNGVNSGLPSHLHGAASSPRNNQTNGNDSPETTFRSHKKSYST